MKFGRILIALFAVALVFIAVTPRDAVTTSAADGGRTQALKDKISALEDEIEEYESQIADLKNERAAGLEAKAKLDALVAATSQKIEVAAELKENLTEQIAETNEAITNKEADIEKTFQKFLDRMVASYEQGEASYLSLLFNASDMADFLSRVDMVNSMLDYDRDLKIKYENEKVELENLKARLDDDVKYQENLIVELEADKERYETLSAEQEEYLNTIQADIGKSNALLEEAKKLDNELDAELQNLLRQESGAGLTSSGNFAWPLYGYTYISSGFGWRTLFGAADYHLGVDIPAPSGTPIHAANSGIVKTAVYHWSYGNYVLIDHGTNAYGVKEATLYAHMSVLGCTPGQYVTKGEVIGYVGNTGNSYGSHLHFETRFNGEVDNPLNHVSPY